MNKIDFLKLPIEERRNLLKEMADDPEIQAYYRQLFEPKPSGRLLTGNWVGDCLDLEKDGEYPCSDGSIVKTISVDALIAKTASIKDAEIEQLNRQIEDITKQQDAECERKCKLCSDATENAIKFASGHLEAECQARMEALIEEIETRLKNMYAEAGYKSVSLQWVESLIRELKATHKGGEGC